MSTTQQALLSRRLDFPPQISYIKTMAAASIGFRYVVQIAVNARQISNIHAGIANSLYGTSPAALATAATALQT